MASAAATAPQPTVDTAAAALAAQLGESPDKVVTRDAQWSRFMQEGAHIHVTYRRWRAVTRATLADLGLEPDLPRNSGETDQDYAARVKEARAATERVLQLGHWRLLPPEWLKRAEALEVRGRGWLEDVGYKTFWGWWVHTSRYQEWLAKHREHMAAYEAYGDAVYQQWDTLMAQVRADLQAEGFRAYVRARSSAAYRAGILNLPDSADAFVDGFVARIMRQVPDKDEVRAKHGCDYAVELVPMAAQVAADEARAQQIRLDAVTAQMAADIRRTEAQRAAEGMRQFVGDIQGQVRGQLYDVAVDCLDALRKGKGGKVSGATTRRLRNLCDAVSKTVFWEDEALEARMAELRGALAVSDSGAGAEALSGALQALGAESRLVLLELDRVGNRAPRADLGLSDDMGSLERTARRARVDSTPDVSDGDTWGRVATREARADLVLV